MGQKSQLWSDISPRDSLDLFAKIYMLSREEYLERLEELTTLLSVKHLLGVQVRKLSLGEHMKFELIAALLHNPKILFLDEPTIGLDLIAKDTVRSFLLKELKKRGVTLILSSHDMEDILEICDQLMVIANGELKFFGNIHDFEKADNTFKNDALNRIK